MVVSDALDHVQCAAPIGPGIGDVRLVVTVTGTGNTSVPFLYTAPAVTGVNVAACAADTTAVIQVTGTNLGVRNSAVSPDPVVYLGDSVCVQPQVLDTLVPTVQCTALTAPVGAYRVMGALELERSPSRAVVALPRRATPSRTLPHTPGRCHGVSLITTRAEKHPTVPPATCPTQYPVCHCVAVPFFSITCPCQCR